MSIEKLDHLSVLEITGDDAISFLQGQLTNDIKLANTEWQYSGYCNPKGRLLGLFTLWRSEDKTYVIIDNSLKETLVKRLKMYVMRSKVDINTADLSVYGIIGESSLLELAPQANKELANSKYSIQVANEVQILGFKNRHLCITAAEINIVQTSSTPSNKSLWHSTNIEEGLPEVTATSSELFIPQMLNLDFLNGINFKKGCYTGQEIVARMHYLGKLKQRMFVCHLENSSNKIKNGDKIFASQDLDKSVGNIVSSNDSLALAVLRLDSIENSDSQFWLDNTTSISVKNDQPYSLEKE